LTFFFPFRCCAGSKAIVPEGSSRCAARVAPWPWGHRHLLGSSWRAQLPAHPLPFDRRVLYQLPIAAVTNRPKLSGLKRHKPVIVLTIPFSQNQGADWLPSCLEALPWKNISVYHCCFSYFSYKVLCFCPWLASDHYPPICAS
jgi:hypothetical protein